MTEETKPDDTQLLEEIGDYKYGFHDRDDNYVFKSDQRTPNISTAKRARCIAAASRKDVIRPGSIRSSNIALAVAVLIAWV